MAFNTVVAGSEMASASIRQVIDALSGTAGSGQPIILTKLNDASSWALDVANADSTNSYGLRVQDSAGNNLLLVYKNNVTIGASAANDTMTINANISGKVYIGDSANAKMTVGLTINQGANDDEVLAFKSSDIAHGVTDYAETDTYFLIMKHDATAGGASLRAFNESSGAAIALWAAGVTDVTTKTTAATGYIEAHAYKKTGTSITTPGADANLMVVLSGNTARFIFDQEGSFHADVESTTFDVYDDVALLNALDTEFKRRNGDPVKEEWAAWLQEHKETLQREKVVNFYDPDGPRAMVNFTKLAMLHTGAIRQLGQQNTVLRAELAEMRQKLLPEVA